MGLVCLDVKNGQNGREKAINTDVQTTQNGINVDNYRSKRLFSQT